MQGALATDQRLGILQRPKPDAHLKQRSSPIEFSGHFRSLWVFDPFPLLQNFWASPPLSSSSGAAGKASPH